MITPSHSSSWAGRSPSSSRRGANVCPISKARTSGIWWLALSATTSRRPGARAGRRTDRSMEMGFCSAIRLSGASQPMALSRHGSKKAYVMAGDRPASVSARVTARRMSRSGGWATGTRWPPRGGVGVEPEGARGPADGAGIEVGGLEEDRGRGRRHLGGAPTHDAAHGDGPLGVTDHEHVGGEGAVLAVERAEPLAGAGAPDHDP